MRDRMVSLAMDSEQISRSDEWPNLSDLTDYDFDTEDDRIDERVPEEDELLDEEPT